MPIPAKPIVADALSASIIGGIFGGAGIGIALMSGGSSGGMDIVGMFFTKKFKGFSVGQDFTYVKCRRVWNLCCFVWRSDGNLLYNLFGSKYARDRPHSHAEYKC